MNLKLIKNNTEIEVKAIKLEIIKSITMGECTIPEDIVNKFDIPYDQVINLFSDPHFISEIGKYSKARLNMSFHSKSIPKLLDIIDSEDNKEAIQAIKLIAQLTNNLKSVGTDVNINLNLENLVKEAEKQVKVFDIESRKVG